LLMSFDCFCLLIFIGEAKNKFSIYE